MDIFDKFFWVMHEFLTNSLDQLGHISFREEVAEQAEQFIDELDEVKEAALEVYKHDTEEMNELVEHYQDWLFGRSIEATTLTYLQSYLAARLTLGLMSAYISDDGGVILEGPMDFEASFVMAVSDLREELSVKFNEGGNAMVIATLNLPNLPKDVGEYVRKFRALQSEDIKDNYENSNN